MSDDIGEFSIHIIGLGLMGGSLAMALRGKARRITAQDLDESVLAAAVKSGVIDDIGEPSQADIVVLAVPADRIVGLIGELGLRPGTVVIDIGSTKMVICEALDGLPADVQAVGGHPMCGLAENGFRNAASTLYQDSRFVLCETQRTTPQARDVSERLVKACGAIPLWMDRQRHDFLTALTSHLPHLLSFALMRLAMEVSEQEAELFELAAGGFDGATRLARTDEAMITGMFKTNATNIRALVARLFEHMSSIDTIFEDTASLNEELRRIMEARRQYSSDYGERPIA